jgi:hypothetical protein
MSTSENDYVALFADDDPVNLSGRDKYPHIFCMPVSDTPIVVDLESGLYIRSKANTNCMQQMIDDRFAEDFGNERLYHARSGLSIRQIDGIYDHTLQHPNIRHVFFDHDLTLTCHQGLISVDQMCRVCESLPLTVSKYFDQWVSYFLGSTRRYQALCNLLANLKAKNIKTYILTKQPDTVTIEHFLRLCKLDAFFPRSRCISSTLIGKEKLTIINEIIGPSHVSRSPRSQSKPLSDHPTSDALRKKSPTQPIKKPPASASSVASEPHVGSPTWTMPTVSPSKQAHNIGTLKKTPAPANYKHETTNAPKARNSPSRRKKS